MYGRILNTIINIMFITYLLLLVSFYFLHEGMRENINNINYSTIDTIAISGQFSEETYNNLKEKILTYNGANCNYEMTIKYEKKMSVGVYDTFYIKDAINTNSLVYNPDNDPGKIITTTTNKYPMYKGDKITIYLSDKEQTLYGKLISAPFLGMMSTSTRFNITSLKSTVIGRDADKLVNGYEVRDEINSNDRDYEIILTTEMTTTPLTFTTTDKYNDTVVNFRYLPETGVVDKYHIFSNGNYYRSWEDININGKLDATDIVSFYQTIK